MAEQIDCFEAFLRGDPTAIGRILVAYRDPLINYGVKLISRVDIAEDAAIEAFRLLAEKMGQFEDETHIKKFLHRTVKNKCLTAAREINRCTSQPGIVESISDTNGEETWALRESELHSEWIINKIKAYLLRLPPKRRQDFHAYYFDSKTFEAIATERGTHVDTVRQNVGHALKDIRKYLKDKKYPGLV